MKNYNLEEVLNKLKSKTSKKYFESSKNFGVTGKGRLGVSVPNIRKIGKEIGTNHNLALELWETKIPEAMILASIIGDAKKLISKDADIWVLQIQDWDVCDMLCMNLLEKTSYALEKINKWYKSDKEFVKRTAYALIACLAWHNKEANDTYFIKFFPIIKEGVTDDRNFVRKAVNWALRNIGKKNLNLNREAIKFAREIEKIENKTAKWIATDALKELQSKIIQDRLKKLYEKQKNNLPRI